MMRAKSLGDRLAQYAPPAEEGGCRIWSGYRDRDGYAIACMTIDGVKKNRKVHRLVYEEAFGPIPADAMVCHRCDTPSCVSIDHLFLGTARENNEDMWSKGRWRAGRQDNRGKRNPNSRLTPDAVATIRSLHKPGARSGPNSTGALAKRFGIGRTQVQRISNGKAWRAEAALIALYGVEASQP